MAIQDKAQEFLIMRPLYLLSITILPLYFSLAKDRNN